MFKEAIILRLNAYSNYISAVMQKNGFVCPPTLISEIEREDMLGKLMLVVSEVAEAGEAVRDNDYDNFQEELADTFIRLMHIVGTMGIDIESRIRDKMEINERRPYRHGKSTSI